MSSSSDESTEHHIKTSQSKFQIYKQWKGHSLSFNRLILILKNQNDSQMSHTDSQGSDQFPGGSPWF